MLFAMSGTYALLRDALEHRLPEMRLAAMQEQLAAPSYLPDIERVR